MNGTSINEFSIRIGNKFYHVERGLTANWYEAAHNCRKMGGNLLNIESCEEMDAILSILPKVPLNDSRYWISSYCLAGKREFISITTGEPMPYNNVYINAYLSIAVKGLYLVSLLA